MFVCFYIGGKTTRRAVVSFLVYLCFCPVVVLPIAIFEFASPITGLDGARDVMKSSYLQAWWLFGLLGSLVPFVVPFYRSRRRLRARGFPLRR